MELLGRLHDIIDRGIEFDLLEAIVCAHDFVFIASNEITKIRQQLWIDYDLMMTCQPPSFDQPDAFTINEPEGR